LKNILTIDVEELFQTEYSKGVNVEQVFRAPLIIPCILTLLDKYKTHATFFVVGEIAERYPSIIKEIVNKGHEVAFHSQDHRQLIKKTPELFEEELESFNKLLLLLVGQKCLGFRAPSFSLTNKTQWLFSSLEKKGFLYDSSLFPSWTPLYGNPKAPMIPYRPQRNKFASNDINGKIWEFPVAIYSFLKIRLPAAGGFYLRASPSLLKKAIKQKNKSGVPAVIYVHSWEFDADIPRVNLNPFKYFITFHNLEKVPAIVEKLLKQFEFTSFSNYIDASAKV
jgi:peptidoglycan-N-acetylglucosamine deacetylase